MKWLFAALVALNLIVFAGMVANKITQSHRRAQQQQPQQPVIVAQQPAQPQIIINTGNGGQNPTVSTNGSITANGIPAGSTIGRLVGKTGNDAARRRTRTAVPQNGAEPQSSSSGRRAEAEQQGRPKMRDCTARVSLPSDDYHRIKGLLNKYPHAASSQVVQGGGEGDSLTSTRMNVVFMSVSNGEAIEIQNIVGRYGKLHRSPCDH